MSLARKLNGRPLLPLLQRLEVKTSPWSPLASILLLSPTITNLTINTSASQSVPDNEGADVGESRYANHLMQFIACPSSMGKSGHPFYTIASTEARKHLDNWGQFRSLRDVDLLFSGISLSHATLLSLSILDNLRRLACHVRPDSSPIPSFDRRFPALTQLALGASSQELPKLIRAIASPRLRDLCFVLDEGWNNEELARILSTTRPVLPAQLRSLEIYSLTDTRKSTYPSGEHQPHFLKHVLEPMLSLHELTEFNCLAEYYPHDVTDDDISALAHAWPKLRDLCISQHQDYSTNSQLTVAGLVTLAQHCPDLENIELSNLNTEALPDPETVPRMDDSRVETLQINMSLGTSGADLRPLAVILDRLFPHLSLPFSLTESMFASAPVGHEKLRSLLEEIRTARLDAREESQTHSTSVSLTSRHTMPVAESAPRSFLH